MENCSLRSHRLPIWIRNEVRKRDRWRCVACGRAGRLEVDHIDPVANGGNDSFSNLQSLCRDCHIEKTSRENALRSGIGGLEEWLDFAKSNL